jgi:hypothetical protein
MTSMPTWAVYLISFGTPLSAFLGTILGQLFTRQASRELDHRARHAEAMRMLRWAAEQATSDDDRTARVGTELLGTMAESEALDSDDQAFVDAALGAVIDEPLEQYYDRGGAPGVVEMVSIGADDV